MPEITNLGKQPFMLKKVKKKAKTNYKLGFLLLEK